MPWRRFAIFNFLGAAVWVSVISTVGYFFGRHFERLEQGMKRFDVLVVILVVLVAGVLWWRNRRANARASGK